MLRAMILSIALLCASLAWAGPEMLWFAANSVQYITNGFETGNDGWTLSGGAARSTDAYLTGAYSVRLPSGGCMSKSWTQANAGSLSLGFFGLEGYYWDFTLTTSSGTSEDVIIGEPNWGVITFGSIPAGSVSFSICNNAPAGTVLFVDDVRYPQ